MTLDQIDRMVRQANPVPDLTALEPVDASVLDQRRRTEMQTDDRIVVDREPDKPRTGLLIGIAAAAAIIIGALLLLQPREEAPVADQPTTTAAVEPSAASPMEIATAFVDAYAAFDIEAATAYLSPDAIVDIFGDVETWPLGRRFLQAHGTQLFIESCEAKGAISVRCRFDYQALRSDEIGLGPFSSSYFSLTVQDGKITVASMYWAYMENLWSAQMWEPFAAWVGANHPEDGAVMYADWPLVGDQAMTEESIPLWEQRSREYVEYVKTSAVETATAFVEAYGRFDMDEAFSYLATDAELPWPGDVEGTRLYNRVLQAHGFQLLLGGCGEPASSSPGIRVRCLFDYHAIRSNEIGRGPFEGSYFDIVVNGERIISASMNLPWVAKRFADEMWEPFAQWVRENYPEDILVMYASSVQIRESVSEESIALWEQRSREYVEFVNGS